MFTTVAKFILNYILFFWGIAWRTSVFSILAAVLSAVALAILAASQNWPPESIEELAPVVGLPITLSVIIFVVYKQSSRFIKAHSALSAQ